MERSRELPCAPAMWSNGNLTLEAGFAPPPVQEICFAQEKRWPCVRTSSATAAADFSSELERPSVC